jgi:hypothetical protein
MRYQKRSLLFFCFFIFFLQIFLDAQVNPDTAQKAGIDRFSMEAGHLFVRDSSVNFPGPNEPIDMDQGPFITHGFGPDGQLVSYYNFDVQPTVPAPIYVLIRDGESSPVEGQLNIVNVIPGDSGYNDFWEVQMVTVPANYVANTITSFDEIVNSGYAMQETKILVNCPIVPESSTADLRFTNESKDLVRGWYKGMVVFYFNFSEKAMMATGQDMVPVSPIYVTFNINPDQPGGGPASGFKTDTTGRAHNVPAMLPDDDGYSPLWSVNIYDNADFNNVHNLETAMAANILATGAAIVNCPIVSVETATGVSNNGSELPAVYSLSQNYPNPFNPSTVIEFSVINNEHVSLKIYNSIGEEITTLVNDVLPAGNYSIRWNAENLASGIYFYVLTTDNFKSTKKLVLLR